MFTTPPFRGLDALERERAWPAGSLRRVLWGDYGEVGGRHPWHRLERGEITLDEYWQDFDQRVAGEVGEGALTLEEFQTAMAGSFAVSYPMVHCVRDLAGDYRTAVVTNNAREFGEFWKQSIPVGELFDVVVDSCELGVRKPEPAIFERALDALGVPAERALFLDDMACNVEGARALGIRAIQVHDPAAAVGELRAALDGGRGRT